MISRIELLYHKPHPENLHLRPLFCFYKGWLTRINHDSTFTLYIYIALNDFVVDVNHDLFYNHKNVAGLLLPEIYLRILPCIVGKGI